jgi:hypothetical protein
VEIPGCFLPVVDMSSTISTDSHAGPIKINGLETLEFPLISRGQEVVASALGKTNGEMFLHMIGLFVMVVSIVLQDDLQFRRLNFVEQRCDAVQKFLWLV